MFDRVVSVRRKGRSFRAVPRTVWLVLLLTTLACAAPPSAENVQLVPNPNPAAPLAGILTFTSDRPVVPTLQIDDGERRQTVTPDPEPRTEHEIAVLGLRPSRVHQVTVTIADERGRESELDPLELETPPLPEDFPPIAVPTRRPASMEPGVTMVPVFRWKNPGEGDDEWAVAFAVDAEGEVVWYYEVDHTIGEVRRAHSGNLLTYGGRDGRLYEIDMLGNVVQEWHNRIVLDDQGEPAETSRQIDTDTVHHDVLELPSGNFLALGLEVRHVEDFPSVYPPGTQRGAANLAGDVLIEFRRDGSSVRTLELLDVYDPERLGYGSLSSDFYEEIYEGRYDPLPIDISHSNALVYLEDEDAVVVSSNRQCALFKIGLSDGDVQWILGMPDGWKEPWTDKLLEPKGDVTWPCHQHGVEQTPSGTWLLFDNGGDRAIPPNPPMPPDERYSRVVEYRVDEEAGTVEEVWSYGPEHERFISPFISDADHLPDTGNVLITDGGRMAGPDGEVMGTFGGRQWARILEVTHEEEPEKVWELVIDDPAQGYSIYRSQRLASLYPKLDRPTG